MNWAWRFGMTVLTGVPAIVGGGLFWHFFEKWTPVAVWEGILLIIMGIVIFKGNGTNSTAH